MDRSPVNDLGCPRNEIKKPGAMGPKELRDLGGTLEVLRSRLLFKCLDAIATSPLRSKKKCRSHIRSIFQLRSSYYDRVASIVNFADSLIPGSARCASNIVQNFDKIPFQKSEVALIGYGAGSTVYLLKCNDSKKILKIYRRSLGKSLPNVKQVSAVYERNHHQVTQLYEEDQNIVVPGHYLVLHGPIIGAPAAASLHPYISGEKSDFFQDYSNDDLGNLIRNHEYLRKQFISFAETTISHYETRGICVDFLGKNNLTLERIRDRLRLAIIDYGIFDFKAFNRELDVKRSLVEQQIYRLKSILINIGKQGVVQR